MTGPHRVLGLSYSVNPKEPMSADVAYTRRSLIIVGLIVAGMALFVLGIWHHWGWDIGVSVLGLCFIAVVVVGGTKAGQAQ